MKLLIKALCLLWATTSWAAFEVINLNQADEGFNAATYVTPEGGNSAIFVGQARLNALNRALLLFDQQINFSPTLKVEASGLSLGGTRFAATLAQAGPLAAAYNFTKAPYRNTLYPIPLANHLAGYDLSPNKNDIVIEINTDIDSVSVLDSARWYYGYDHSAAEHVDMLSTLMHELVHGLGFITYMESDGSLYQGLWDSFLWNMEHAGASPSRYVDMTTNTQRAAGLTDDGNLHWIGTEVNNEAIGWLTDGLAPDNHVLLFAPTTYTPGASVSHFDPTLSPNELMEPYDTGTTEMRLALAALRDLGWNFDHLQPPTLPETDLALQLTNNASQFVLTVQNLSTDTAQKVFLTFALPSSSTLESTPANCTFAGKFWRCALPDLPGNQTYTLTLNLQTSSTLLANVSSATADPNTTNNLINTTDQPVAEVIASLPLSTVSYISTDTPDTDTPTLTEETSAGGGGAWHFLLLFLLLLLRLKKYDAQTTV